MDDACACEKCGQSSPSHHFWCSHCGADLSRTTASAFCKLETQLEASGDLYGLVLRDLERLFQQGGVPRPVYDTIERFYSTQLQTLAATQSCIDLVRDLGPLARAPVSELEATHLELQDTIEQCPREYLLRHIVKDIDGELTQRRMSALSDATVRKWLAAAAGCSDWKEAERYLKQAEAISPGDAEVAKRLEELWRRRTGIQSVPAPHAVTARPQLDTGTARSDRGSPEPDSVQVMRAPALVVPEASGTSQESIVVPSFGEEEEVPSSMQRILEAASEWSAILKPFLLDNVGWFVGAFLIVAGFLVLIAAKWSEIGENPILMKSLVFGSLAATTGIFFALAYYMRVKYPQLETSSNVLLIIVALLIPLVFAAAAITTLSSTGTANLQPSPTAITVSSSCPASPLVDRERT